MTIGPAQQLRIIDRQIQEWAESAFNAEVAHRVHTRLKSERAVLDRYVDAMKNAEIAMAELAKLRAEVEANGQAIDAG